MSKNEIRKRNNRVQVRLDNKEHQAFLKAVKRSRLSQEVYLRHLIIGVVPQDAPPPDYYAMMQQLYRIGNNLNQIAQKAHTLNVIDVQRYDAAVSQFEAAVNPEANKVFTKHVRMGLDGRKHRRNLNTVVVGGSGSGKSRFYALINLLQACSSYFVLDCKGELLRMTGTFLKMRGYEIKVLDLLSMEKSHCFNPFAYLQTDNDVQKLVTSLFKATTPKGSQSNDPFWDTAASMLLSAIIFYLLYEAPEKNYVNLSEIEFELLSDEEIEAELLSGGKQNEEPH